MGRDSVPLGQRSRPPTHSTWLRNFVSLKALRLSNGPPIENLLGEVNAVGFGLPGARFSRQEFKGVRSMDELIYQSAKTIAQAIRDKKLSSVEVVEAHLSRIEDVNLKLNAVVQLCTERALAEARQADHSLSRGEIQGALHGVPITLKDSHDTEGIVTTGGTKGRASFVPDKDSTVAARLRGAGAILLGKTNTPELTMSAETDNLIYGQTKNPYDLTRTPGGSSGGAASIIAAGGSPLDMGSDTGGSIRYPAHFCGIPGLKPTSGRVPRTGHIIPYGMGATDAFTTIGPLSRYVEDLVLALPIIAGVDWRDPTIVPMPIGSPDHIDLKTLRVAVYTDNGKMTPTKETIDAVNAAFNVLSDAGASVNEDMPSAFEHMGDLPNSVSGADRRAGTKRLLELAGTTEVYPSLQKLIDNAAPVSAEKFSAALEHLDRFRAEMIAFMEDYDIIVAPVAAFPALPFGMTLDDDHKEGMTYCRPYNMTGWPATVVRCGTSPEGLPIGVQAIARPWREDLSLAVAMHLEKSLGGWQRPSL